MAGGKVQHWKHGWIPVEVAMDKVFGRKAKPNPEDNFDDKQLAADKAEKEARKASAVKSEAEARAARLEAHRQHNAVRDAAMHDRFAQHTRATEDKRKAQEARYAAHTAAMAAKKAKG